MLEKEGHGIVNLKDSKSCDVYFYEVARNLSDRLSETAKRFGLAKELTDFIEERSGVVPNTKWKKYIGQNWYLGVAPGIGQGYFQSTPLQLCFMTAQIANGGFKIKPRIIHDGKNDYLRDYLKFKNENPPTSSN